MDLVLNEVECRVLGSLMEKDITTPDYYPLSLNALMNACNQKSNREPVMELNENQVRDALASLSDMRLAGPTSSADSRVTKYEHRMQEVFNFTRRETAVICVLLLRGPQTPGELRGRTERMFQFEDLQDVQGTLQKLMQREPPLVKMLPRQPGTKESRFAQLFSGDLEGVEATSPTPIAEATGSDERVAKLEQAIAELRQEMAELKQEVAEMKKVFD